MSKKPCSFSPCDRLAVIKGRCEAHNQQYRKHGEAGLKPLRNFWGGRRVRDHGYVQVRRGERNKNTKWVYEHRAVMEAYLGRPLLDHENVHHKNGDRGDNRLENLELWSTSQPCGQRVQDKLDFAREILRLYGGLEENN